jgi:4-hydroxybenzoate polyprenyltransferase
VNRTRKVKEMLLRTTKFLISTSLLLSLDGALIVIFGSFLYGIPINYQLTIASFLAVFSVYNLNKATDKREDSINRPETASKSTLYYLVPSIAAMIVSLFLGVLNGVFAVLILSTPFIVGLFYSVKISPKLPRLKEVLGAKSFLVAFTWSMNGAFLPLPTQLISLDKITLVFLYIFIQVTVNTILFDALDAKGDSLMRIKTLPIVLGPKKAKSILLLLNSTLIIWLTFCEFEGFFTRFMYALFFGVIYSYVLIVYFLGKNKRTLRAELMIDGEWMPIVTLMKLIIK